VTPGMAASIVAGASRSPSATSTPSCLSAVALSGFADEHPYRLVSLREQPSCLGPHLPCCRNEDHVLAFLRV
jgi:hypothetical protein